MDWRGLFDVVWSCDIYFFVVGDDVGDGSCGCSIFLVGSWIWGCADIYKSDFDLIVVVRERSCLEVCAQHSSEKGCFCILSAKMFTFFRREKLHTSFSHFCWVRSPRLQDSKALLLMQEILMCPSQIKKSFCFDYKNAG